MKNEIEKFNDLGIKDKIYSIRGIQVMFDSDLAELYGVETKVMNQAVKRNKVRFPDNFRFQLTQSEKEEVVTNCDHLTKLKFSYILPYAFTEQGVAMLSAILRSETAVRISIQIMDAFVKMRKIISGTSFLSQRLDRIENKQLEYKVEADTKFEKIFKVMEANDLKPKQGIFFEGQTFDAYVLVSNLIKKAANSIILIDNYID